MVIISGATAGGSAANNYNENPILRDDRTDVKGRGK